MFLVICLNVKTSMLSWFTCYKVCPCSQSPLKEEKDGPRLLLPGTQNLIKYFIEIIFRVNCWHPFSVKKIIPFDGIKGAIKNTIKEVIKGN